MTRNEIIEQVNDLLEEEFEIEKSDPAEDLPKMKTFNDLYDYIEQHLEK